MIGLRIRGRRRFPIPGDGSGAPIDFIVHPDILRRFVAPLFYGPDFRISGVMGRSERSREIARRRKRKLELPKLRAKFAAATSETEKAEILAKARRMSPFIELAAAAE